MQNFRENHPTAVKVAGATLITAGGMVLLPVVVVGGLNAVGFTASGVAAGSIATGIQSSVYGGLTTGLFSTCQYYGTTSLLASAASVIPGIGSLAAGASLLSTSQKKVTGTALDRKL